MVTPEQDYADRLVAEYNRGRDDGSLGENERCVAIVRYWSRFAGSLEAWAAAIEDMEGYEPPRS